MKLNPKEKRAVMNCKRSLMNCNRVCPICHSDRVEKVLNYEPSEYHIKYLIECNKCKASWTVINFILPVPEIVTILNRTRRLDQADDYKNLVAGLLTQYTNIDYEMLDKQIKTLSKVMHILETPIALMKESLLNEDDMENLEGIMNGMCFEWENRPEGVCPDA